MRNHSRRFFLQTLTGLSFAVILHACGDNSEPSYPTSPTSVTPEEKPKNLLTIGVNIGNIPWEFENEEGELVGFEIDLIQEIGKRLNQEIEFDNIAFIDLFPAVLSNRINAAMSSITITEERLETVDFAQPYYDSDQSLTVKADSEIATLEDMKGKIVAVDNGSTGDQWVQENESKYQFSEIRRYEGIKPAMEDLKAGLYDGYISDIPALLYYAKNNPEVKVVARIPTGEQYSIMFAKGNPLRDEVNEIITQLKEEGFLAEIHEKWFGTPPDEGTSTVEVLPVP